MDFFFVKLSVLMGIFEAFFLTYNNFLHISHNGALINFLAIIISFTLLLMSLTQCFHLFLL